MAKAAILIDGGYFLTRLPVVRPDVDTVNAKAVADSVGQLVHSHLRQLNEALQVPNPASLLYRSFYYDARPYDQKGHTAVDQRAIDYSKTEQAIFRNELFEALRRRPNLALRLGEVRRDSDRAWILKPEPQRRLLRGEITFNDVSDGDFAAALPFPSILRLLWRRAAANPRLTLLSLLTLAVAVGATVAITAEEDRPGAAPVVVLGDGLWRSRFGADPGVVGRVVEIDRERVEIVGVMPPGFAFPRPETALWRPMGLDPENVRLGFFGLNGVARMADGASLERVRAELGAMLSNPEELLPDQPGAPVMAREFRPLIVPLRTWVVGDIEATLWILLGAVGFLLLIACANVANLFLVRAEARHGEVAIRAALGESRGRLVASVLVESLAVGVAGGLAALLLAQGMVRLLVRFGPRELGHVCRLVLAESGGLALVGATLGVGAALLLTEQLRAILFETSPLDQPVRRVTSTAFIAYSALLCASPQRVSYAGFVRLASWAVASLSAACCNQPCASSTSWASVCRLDI